MNRQSLISLTVAAITMVMANGAKAQETPTKLYSVGPVLEFGGNSSSFGIKGKISISPQYSIRPTILFGYKPTITKGDLTKSVTNLLQQQFPSLSPSEIETIVNNPSTQNSLDTAANLTGSGTAYGLAATYDFRSPDSKISGYVGPRIQFASGSTGIVSSSETSIGLIAGADYLISPDFTAGLSATYDFSKSATFTSTSGLGKISGSSSGGNFQLGLNVGYNF